MMAFLKDSEAAPNMRPTAAAQQCALDPKALAAAQQNVGGRFHFMIAHAIRSYLSALTPAEAGGLVDEPDAWRYRYEQKEGVWGKWTVQKNKPSWWRANQPDVQLEPLYSAAALASERAAHAETKRALDEALKALEPFSESAGDLDENAQDRHDLWEHPVSMNITIADLRAARRVREGGKVDG